jgi:hypothetical protein
LATRISRLFAPFALLLAAACSDTVASSPPATDRFYYPTGLAIRHVDLTTGLGCVGGSATCQTQLLVASSNFDLRYDSATGGTVIAVDVDKALATPLSPLVAPALLGVARVGSFGGALAIVDEASCPGWQTTLGNGAQALVASRSQNALYRVNIDAQGSLTCGEGCRVPLEASLGDPYGVTVACGTFSPAAGGTSVGQSLAFVTYLRAPNSEGFLSRVDLAAQGSPRTLIDLLTVPTHSTVFDPVSTRLYVTERFAAIGYTPLRWVTLAAPGNVAARNIFDVIRGSELRGMALSSDSAPGSPPSRAYLALRIYDVDQATSTGVRPINDLAGALAVMDLHEGLDGQPSTRILNVVPIDRGATEISVVPRDLDPATRRPRVDPVMGRPKRDLVAVTCTDDGTVALYDDEIGAIAKVFDVCDAISSDAGDAGAPPPCDPGDPLVGKQPFGLAVEPLANGHARLYVGSFDRSWVNVIEIDPLQPSAAPAAWARIGPERQ